MTKRKPKSQHLPRGPKSKLTPTVRLKIEQAAAMDCNYDEIALYAGVSRATFYRWLDENPDLRDQVEQLRNYPMLKARETIVNSLDDSKNAQWYTERKRKDEFATKTQVEQTTTIALNEDEKKLVDKAFDNVFGDII